MASTNPNRPLTYFDIQIAGKDAGRIVFSIYTDLVPKTAENFRMSSTLSLKASHVPSRKKYRCSMYWGKGSGTIGQTVVLPRFGIPQSHKRVSTRSPLISHQRV